MKGNQLGRPLEPRREVLAADIAAVAVEEMMVEKTESAICLLVVAKMIVSVKWRTWEKLNQENRMIIRSRNRVVLK